VFERRIELNGWVKATRADTYNSPKKGDGKKSAIKGPVQAKWWGITEGEKVNASAGHAREEKLICEEKKKTSSILRTGRGR